MEVPNQHNLRWAPGPPATHWRGNLELHGSRASTWIPGCLVENAHNTWRYSWLMLANNG